MSPNEEKISIENLIAAYTYDPETGLFRHAYDKMWGSVCKARKGDIAKSSANGYIILRVKNIPIKAHRAAVAITTGEFPNGVVDHINHDKTDNRLSNLRVTTSVDNNRNCKLALNNTSGVTGVYWDKNRGKWTAKIKVNYKIKNLGRFDNFEDACAARKAAEQHFGFHENHGK